MTDCLNWLSCVDLDAMCDAAGVFLADGTYGTRLSSYFFLRIKLQNILECGVRLAYIFKIGASVATLKTLKPVAAAEFRVKKMMV